MGESGGRAAPAPAAEPADWRTNLTADTRRRIVEKLLDAMRKSLPDSGTEVLSGLQQIVMRFEEKIYNEATSSVEYLHRISLQLIRMENRSQTHVPNCSSSSAVRGPNRCSNPASTTMQSQILIKHEQQLPISIVEQSESYERILPHNNLPTSAQNTGSLSSKMAYMTRLTKSGMLEVVSRNYSLPASIEDYAQNSSNNILNGKGDQLSDFINAQRQQLFGRQKQYQNMEQPENNYQEQQEFHTHYSKQNRQQQGNTQSILYSYHQPQQPFLLQRNQLHGSQPSPMLAQQPNTLGQNARISSLNQQQQPPVQNNSSGRQQNQQLTQRGSLPNIQQHQNLIHMISEANIMEAQYQSNRQASLVEFPFQGQQPSSQLQMQSSNALQMGSTMDPQKQHTFQAQEGIPEASSMPIYSTAQTGHKVPYVQEELYQKLKIMKDMYYLDLSKIYDKISSKCQQLDAPAQGSKHSEQMNIIKTDKDMLQILLQFLCFPKSDIRLDRYPGLAGFEKWILYFLNLYGRENSAMLQGHQLLPHMSGMSFSGMPQQVPLQISHQKNHDNQMNQMQLTAVQSSGLSSTPMPLSTKMAVSHEQQLEFVQNLDQIDGDTVVSSPQNAIASMHQTCVNGFQQGGMSTLPKFGLDSLPRSINNLHSNATSLQYMQRLNHQHGQWKEHPLQMLMHAPQQEEQFEQHCIHPQSNLEKEMHQQQELRKQHLRQKLSHKQQMSQFHWMSNEVSDMNMGQDLDFVVSQMSPQCDQHGAQWLYLQQPLKATGPFTNSAELLQPWSSQISQHSPRQTDLQNLHNSFTKTGTPTHTANSPFIPSPSIPLTAPSPISEDPEKITPGVSSISNSDHVRSIQMELSPRQPQTLVTMDTLVMSVSPSLSECTSADSNQRNTAMPETDRPAECQLERLCRVVKSISPKAFRSAVSDIRSIVSLVDGITEPVPSNGHRVSTKKMKRVITARPVNANSLMGSINKDNFSHLSCNDTSDLDSTATSRKKRHKVEVNHIVIEEIENINQLLIHTVLEISDEEVNSVAGSAEDCGTIVKCSYNAEATSPTLKSHFVTAHALPVLYLRFLVPESYPSCSPLLLDKLSAESSNSVETEDLLAMAKSQFTVTLRGFSNPISLWQVAKAWDACARQVITKYAQLNGGGSFSSSYGTWESCLSS